MVDASRGHLTVRERGTRTFRLSVLQMGSVLRVGVRLPQPLFAARSHIAQRLEHTYPGIAPVSVELSNGQLMLDWRFDLPDLYDSALAMETGVHLICALFENALQAMLAA